MLGCKSLRVLPSTQDDTAQRLPTVVVLWQSQINQFVPPHNSPLGLVCLSRNMAITLKYGLKALHTLPQDHLIN